jgi:hypothetical protein
MRKTRNAYTIFVGKRFVKLAIGRYRMRWEDNIDMYRREMSEVDNTSSLLCRIASSFVASVVFCESMAG